MIKYLGLGFSIVLSLLSLGLGIWGCFLPHIGVITSGFGIFIITIYGLIVSIKNLQN